MRKGETTGRITVDYDEQRMGITPDAKYALWDVKFSYPKVGMMKIIRVRARSAEEAGDLATDILHEGATDEATPASKRHRRVYIHRGQRRSFNAKRGKAIAALTKGKLQNSETATA